jgi:hypothetical protein
MAQSSPMPSRTELLRLGKERRICSMRANSPSGLGFWGMLDEA